MTRRHVIVFNLHHLHQQQQHDAIDEEGSNTGSTPKIANRPQNQRSNILHRTIFRVELKSTIIFG
jgi:hypothetical protein